MTQYDQGGYDIYRILWKNGVVQDKQLIGFMLVLEHDDYPDTSQHWLISEDNHEQPAQLGGGAETTHQIRRNPDADDVENLDDFFKFIEGEGTFAVRDLEHTVYRAVSRSP